MQQRLASFSVKSDVLDEQAFRKRFPMMNPEPFPKLGLTLHPEPEPEPIHPEPESRNPTP